MMKNLKNIWDVLNDIGSEGSKALENFYDIACDFSECLVEYRNKNNLTQSQLAKQLDVSQVMVSKYENGDYNFSLKKLCEICDSLEYDITVEFRPAVPEVKPEEDWCLQEEFDVRDIGMEDKQLCQIA